VIQRAKSFDEHIDLASAHQTIATLSEVIRAPAGIDPTHSGPLRRKSMFERMLTLKVAAVTVPALALSAGVAAAATGSLPTPAQSAVAGALAHVGIPLPKGAGSKSANGLDRAATASRSTSGGLGPVAAAVGPSASGAATYGLCTAYAALQGSASAAATTHAVAFSNLAGAAKAKRESITTYCAGIVPSGTTGRSAAGTSHGNAPTDPGPPSSVPASGQANAPSTAGAAGDGAAGTSHGNAPTDPGPPSSVPASGAAVAPGSGSSAGEPAGGPPGGSTSTPAPQRTASQAGGFSRH